nr:uncharacterized protein LOC112009819 [Quercus suber]XP_023897931.1 uncharacterized protein LOC112009819 [Quercus suber]
MVEQARDEFFKQTEELKKVLEDKENEIRLVKEVTVREYRDFDALLSKLGVSYVDGFDDAIRQVKTLYPELDLPTVNINVQEKMSVQPIHSKNRNELFGENAPVNDAPGDGTIVESQVEPKDGQARHIEEKDETPAADV